MSATVARERPAARDRPGAIPDPAVVGEQWSALQGRLDALLEERGRSPQDDRTDPFRASWSHVLKYLPLALLVTFAVVVVPVALVNSVLPRHGWLWSVIAVLAAVGCSLAIASVIAWAWKRCRWSQEVIFADLMIWGLVRHLLVARRLTRARRVFEAAG